MGKSFAIFVLSFILSCYSAYAQDYSVLDIPKGYVESNLEQDLYSSPIRPELRIFQDRILQLEQRVFGLSHLSNDERVKQAELAFQLEHDIIALHIELTGLSNAQASKFEKDSLVHNTVHLYRVLNSTTERLFNDMVRYLDIVLPGPNGPQFREADDNKNGPYYYPNYRSAEVLTDEQKQEFYDEKLKSFLAEGGSLDEIKVLDKALVDSLGHFTWFEYTQDLKSKINVTEGSSGHLLLAKGKRVKAAGQIVLVKNNKNEITMAILTNASGTYKPDMYSIEKLSNYMQKKFKISSDKIIISKGEPLSTQIYAMYLKGGGIDKKEAKSKVQALKEIGKSKGSGSYMSVGCQKFFSGK